MKFTLAWLKEHLDTTATLPEVRDTLTMLGLEVEGIVNPAEALKGFVDAKAKVKLTVTQTILAGDIAATYNDWSGVMTGPDGAKIEMAGKAIEIVHRQPDGTWRFIIDDAFARG